MTDGNLVKCPLCGRNCAATFANCPFCNAQLKAADAPPAPPAGGGAGESAAVPPAAKPPVVDPSEWIMSSRTQGKEEHPVIELPQWAATLIVVAVIGLIGYGGHKFFSKHDKNNSVLCVVNATGKDGMSIRIDGKTVARKLVSSRTETPKAVYRDRIKAGTHTIEALDASGNVVDSTNLCVSVGSHGYLYAPKHDPTILFAVETTAYGSWGGTAGVRSLPPDQSLWEMPEYVHRWFEKSPRSVAVQKGASGAYDRAVRMKALEDIVKENKYF